jgi:1-deoxy-D-xylulose-5-phosphate reductoisomerase
MAAATASPRLGISILGSTGSIGRQTLAVIDALADRLRVVALAAGSASRRFQEQVARYAPVVAAVGYPADDQSGETGHIQTGVEGLIAAATHPEVDIVVVATSGHAAIEPTIRAIEQGKIVALANKEVLVCAGEIISSLVKTRKSTLRPVDSEHSAIWQVLNDSPLDEVSKLILTASGGPFRQASVDALAHVTARKALAHPTWSMGEKISVDSATLMNKGLEVIEAHWIFGVPFDQIEVVVHPESIIHSLVEFVDGAQIGQLGVPDMRLPIQYALTYPERVPFEGQRLRLSEVGSLHFELPDEVRFPALRLARAAGMAGQTYPTVLSAADDEAVEAFLSDRLRFIDIPAVVQRVLDCHQPEPVTLDTIKTADEWARQMAKDVIRRGTS